jgi:ATP-binding cassette subfamily B protein
LGGIRDVILGGFQKVYVRAYENADYQLRTSQAKIQILSNCPRFIIESFGICLISLLAYFLVSTESSKDVIPLLGVLALGIQRMLPVVQLIYSSWSSIKGGQQSVDEGMKLLKESGLHNQGRPIARKSLTFNHKVELLNVSYRYTDKSRWVLNNISLTIKKGEKIGFFGESGSGKSTLLDLLMGLLSPKQGVIKVDGIELNESNRSSWQTRVAHVPQDVYLSDSTIYENIAFGLDMEAIDKNKVIDVANKAQITSTIRELSEDFKTLVGERGVRLSGGQKQRIGLARSLYKDADFLIFDEATSALDPQTEKLVMESIDNLSKDLTILMVAHRISTLKNCTILYEMKDGSIVRSGTYAELFQGKNNT